MSDQKRGRGLRNSRLADMSVTPDGDDIRPAEYHDEAILRDDIVTTEIVPFGNCELLVYVRQTRICVDQPKAGMLLDFAVGLNFADESTDGDWTEIIRVDTEHGFVHMDDFSSGSKVKHTDDIPHEAQTDIDQALVFAHGFIWDTLRKEMEVRANE